MYRKQIKVLMQGINSFDIILNTNVITYLRLKLIKTLVKGLKVARRQ